MIVDAKNERYILGCMACKEECLIEGLAELTDDDFYAKENKFIFGLMRQMYQDGESFTENGFYIRHSEKVRELGINWVEFVDVWAHFPDFQMACRKLANTTKLRRLLRLSDTVRQQIESGADPKEVIDGIEKSLVSMDSSSDGREYLTPKEMAETCINVVAERMDEDTRAKKCIYTGFRSLNRTTGGIEDGDLVILSGSTGGGKSAFAANIARDVAMTQKLPCLYINSEMSREQMALRWSALLGGVSHSKLRGGSLSQDEFAQLVPKLDKLHSGKLHTLTMPDLRVDSAISEIRRYKAHHGIRMVFIDYIGRCDFGDTKNRDDWQVLTGAARRFKTIAQQQGLAIVMLAQLNESGRLAQASYMSHEADLWLSLRKVEDEDRAALAGKPWNVILQIRKGRNAPTGNIPLYFLGERLLFTDDLGAAWAYKKQTEQTAG